MSTYTYSINLNQLIFASFRLLGVFNDDLPPPQTDITNATQTLNLMIKQWMSDGYPLWCVQDMVIPITANTQSYTIGPTGTFIGNRPLRVVDARLNYVATGLDVPLQKLSRQEYNMLGNKTLPGVINSYYYDPQLTNGVLYTYLESDTATMPGNNIILTVQRPIDDMINPSDNFDFPIESLNALKWGLADEMLSDYDVPPVKADRVTAKAMMYKEKILDWSQEDASTFFTVDTRNR